VPLHCPICQAEILDSAETSLRPFCSQRCKLADLHNWLTGVYRVSTPLDPNELGEDEFKLRS
jgi:endogenous inhibitor of DNA gyrase (YacG/DUF329 family)